MEKLSYKSLFIILVVLLIGIVILVRFQKKPPSIEAAWYHTSWTNRLMLTIDHTKVTANQTDFPILVSLASLPADFHSHVNQTDARDIRVTKSDGSTELPREVVYYDAGTDSGELYFKYTGSLSSTTDTQIYIYYGNSSATVYDPASEFGRNNVWDSNYVGVWHLNEVGTTRYDSTSNNNHLAISGTVGNATGKIGTAASFTQAGNLFRTDSNLSNNFPSKNGQTVTDLSVSFWVKATSLVWHDWLGKEDGTGWYFFDNTSTMEFSYINGSEYETYGSSVATGSWYNITGIHNSATNTDYQYVNGAVGGTEVSRTVEPGSSTASFMLGGTTSWPQDANGQIDEVRVSKSARSSTWVSTEHNNLNSPSTFFSATIPTESNNTEPVSYWKFDENVGTSAFDSSGNSRTGTLGSGTSSPTWASGKFNSSLKFDGTNDYVSVPATGITASAGTVSAWVYPTGLGSDATYAMMFSHRVVEGDATRIYMWRNNTNRHFTIGLGNSYSLDTNFTINDNQWYHLTLTWTGANYNAYVNGNLVSSGSSSQPTSIASTAKVGCYFDGTQCFNGQIDDVKIYDFAKTANQVKNEYNDNSGVTVGTQISSSLTNGLVGWWKMDENTGTTVTDSSGNINNGAITNATWINGKYGSGLAMTQNASAQRINVTDPSNGTLDFDTSQNFTISTWVKTTSFSESPLLVRKVIDLSESNPGYVLWASFSGGSNDIICQIYDNNGATSTDTAQFTSNSTLTDGNWHNITCVLNRTYGLYLYIDGVMKASDTGINSTGSLVNAQDLIVGENSATEELAGGIDETRIYNRALNQSEVLQLFKWAAPPIGYWKMEEASWTNNCSTDAAKDSSGNGYNLRSCPTSTGPTGNSVGKVGKAGTFDGSDDYLESTNTVFNLSGQITLSAWARTFSTPAGDVYAIDRTNNNNGYSLGWQGNRFPRIRIGNGSVYTEVTSANAMTANTWYFLSATLDSNGTAKLYVNGIYDTGATNVTLTTSSGQNLRIGSRAAANTVDGQLDEVKIYNYARTQSQIMEDMGTGKPLTPIVSLKFEENSGTLAYDSSGNNFNGTLATGNSSPAWTLGKSGQGLSFDGNDYVQIPDNNYLDFTEDFTLSAWVTRSGGVNEYTISKTDASSDGGYALLIGNLGEVYCRTAHGSGFDDSYTTTGYVTANNTWHHIAASKNGSTCRVYVDGVDRTNTFDTHTSFTANAKNLRIGTQPASGNFTNGKIDEVNIYNYGLNADEIKQLYNRNAAVQSGQTAQTIGATTTNLKYCVPGDTSPCNSPSGEWKFEENTGTITKDTSGNNYTSSTFTGSPAWTMGKDGSGLRFDGANSVVRIVEGSLIDLGNTSDSFTVEGWFKTTTNFSAEAVIVAKYDGTTTLPYSMYLDASEQGCFTFADAGSNIVTTCGTTALNDGKWHHIAGVRKVSNDTSYLFIDGIVVDSTNDITTSDFRNNNDVSIGNAGPSYNTLDFTGFIDDVKIYNYARTPAQISHDYSHGEPAVWYKFDECQGTILHNSISTGYTGTITIGAAGSQTSLGTCNSGTAAAWTNGATGKINSSLSFDGNDDLVTISESDTKGPLDVGTSDSLSVAFWFNPTSLPGGGTYDTYVGKNNGGDGWYSQIYSDGSIEFCVVDTDVHCYQSDQKYAVASSWQHYTVTYTNGDDSSIRLYHNGRLLTGVWSGTASVAIPTNNNPLVFGSNGDSTEEATGKLDDVRIYNYPLTETQIKSIMNNGSASFR